MKTKQILVLAYFLLLSSFLHGQDVDKYFSIGLVPTSLLDPITGSIGVSVEHSITKSLNGELVYGFDPNWAILNWHRDPLSRHHEYKLKLKYLIKTDNRDNLYKYVGLEYFGVYNKYDRQDDIYIEGSNIFSYDDAEVIRKVDGIRLNLGLKVKMSKNIWIDFFIGAGSRSINIDITPKNKTEIFDAPFEEWFTPIDRYAGKKSKIALVAGIKLAYRIY